MTWDQKRRTLRCDMSWYSGRRKSCPFVIIADTPEGARRLAADQGWTRRRRAGSMTDLCGRHKDGGTQT